MIVRGCRKIIDAGLQHVGLKREVASVPLAGRGGNACGTCGKPPRRIEQPDTGRRGLLLLSILPPHDELFR
ncbi:MAG: hypothetical protein JW913_00235 [Chitinispirillaceae bacterium]|nr:hypothetical protein [Chitinispirillaceae bacterium]